MGGDPTGSVASAPASDTATVPSDALATSEPTSDGASVVEGAGEGTTTESEPTPDSDEPVEDGDETTEGDEPSDQTEEQKKLSRKERQRLREAERIESERQAAVEAYKREQQTAAEQAENARKAQEAAQERSKRLASFVGKPTAEGDPGELAKLDQEIESLIQKSRTETLQPTVEFDPEAHDRLIEKAKARKAELIEREAMAGDIEDFVWSHFSGGMATALQWPEMADPTVKQRYWNHPEGIAGSLAVLREAVKAAAKAEHDADVARIRSEHTTAMKALEADRNGWRARAAGEEVPDTTSGGQPAASTGGPLTPERYAAMTFEQRQQLRSTPEGRRAIDAMSARTGFGQRSA